MSIDRTAKPTGIAGSETTAAPCLESPFPNAAVAWLAVAILLTLSFLAFLDRQIVSLMVGMIKADFAVNDSQIGLLQGAAFSIVYTLAALPFGYAVDRYSRRGTIFFGVFLWALAACACGLSGSFSTLLAARLGVGLGEAALNPAIASMLTDLFPKRRLAFAFSVVGVGSLIGSAGAFMVGGAVLHWAGGGLTLPLLGFMAPWKVAFIVTGFPGLFLAFTIFLIPEPARRATALDSVAQKPRWSEVWAFIGAHPRFFSCYIGGFSCLAVTGYAAMSWVPAQLQRNWGWTPGDVGLILGPYVAIIGIIGTLTSGVFVDRLYNKGHLDAQARYYLAISVITGASGVATIFAGSPLLYLILLAPAKFAANFSAVATAGLQLVIPSNLRGRITAVYGICTVFCGATFGPSIVACFTDYVFQDEKKVGLSISVTLVIFSIAAAILFRLAQAPMRRATAMAG